MTRIPDLRIPSKIKTQSQSLLPNFLIVGAAKAGTTSLFHYLRQHPDVFMPQTKEANFFLGAGDRVVREVDPDGQSRSVSKINSLSDYQALFTGAITAKARGEASPKYLYYPGTAQRIKSVIPNTKIIVILRHPVDRAYSDFLHQIRDGQEVVTDFATALREEPRRIEKGWNSKYHYRSRGFYFEQLSRYYATFDPANIHVYLYEDLQKDPANLMRRIFCLLDVDPTFVPDMEIKHNISGVPKNQVLHRIGNFVSSSNNTLLKG